MQNKKYVELAMIRPNLAVQIKYRKALKQVIDMMIKDIYTKTLNLYSNDQPKIAMDENTPQQFDNAITKMFEYWMTAFNSISGIFAQNFIDSVDDHNYSQNVVAIKKLSSLDKESENLTVKFSKESQQVVKAKQSLIQEQINLITNIPQQYEYKVNIAVFEAITRGRDMKYLQKELMQINTITEKRAKLIAKNQIDYATGVINLARASDLGFTHSKWKHSSASKVPRQSHKEANNRIFETAKGCLIEGEYIVPGQKINCNCYTVVVIEI
jgi:uncharacterized protein with gpF-like domain